ncbi:MAG: ATP-grasp domain-containing protein [Candidatus Sericytochromatia bacterium]|nr:ATP-grasp domain-containing protein [Candidatus Sericytochromatia bacterium]
MIQKYHCLPQSVYTWQDYSIQAIQADQIEAIRVWRNAQIEILRQSQPLSAEDQETYFKTVIWPSLSERQPRQVIFSLFHRQQFIGYGGLVHIAWHDFHAEVSFLLDPQIMQDPTQYQNAFQGFLELMKHIAFDELGLNRLSTEIYGFRKQHIALVEQNGFVLEGVLKERVFFKGVFWDAVIHSFLKAAYTQGQQPSLPEPSRIPLNRFPGNILITSAARKIPLIFAVADAARRFHPRVKVYAGDINEHAIAQYYADVFWPMPILADNQAESLKDHCLQHNIRLIIPTRDGELLFWARHRALFQQAGIFILGSDEEALKRCLDKLVFSSYCREQGIPAITAALEPEKIPAPLYVVKERQGAGSHNIGIALALDCAKKHARQLKDPVFQPYIEGQEISIDGYATQTGEMKGIVLRTRDQVLNGESQVTTYFRDAQIEENAAIYARKLGLKGHFVMQAILDSQNILHVIECNCRFGGASTLSLAAGLDTFFWGLLEAHGMCLDSRPFIRKNLAIKQIRIPQDILIYGSCF